MNSFATRVVGTGSIGSRYVRLLASMFETAPRAIPVGGVIRDEELARISILESFDMDERPTVDLTVIATSTRRHVVDLERFEAATRLVLIEKPIAPTFALGCLALKSGKAASSAVSAPLRFMEGYDAVSKLLPYAGRISNVEIVCQSWLPDWRPGSDYRRSYSADPEEGGVLRDLVHEIDYALSLFGSPRSVAADLGHSEELAIEAESSALLHWFYPEFTLSMMLNFDYRGARRSLCVYGESATITWDVLAGKVKLVETRSQRQISYHYPSDLSKDEVLMRQVRAMVWANRDPRLCSIREAVRAIALCDAARESSQKSSPTELSGAVWFDS